MPCMQRSVFSPSMYAKELSSGTQNDRATDGADLLDFQHCMPAPAWCGGTSQVTIIYKVCHLAEASLPALLTFITLQARTRLVWRISPTLILSAADAMQHQLRVRVWLCACSVCSLVRVSVSVCSHVRVHSGHVSMYVCLQSACSPGLCSCTRGSQGPSLLFWHFVCSS